MESYQEEKERGNRDDYTAFVSQIHPKVDERDLFEFFSLVGRVEDIRLIRDQRTQKSKGLCYVEFYEKESVHKAVALTGQLLRGYPITVQQCISHDTEVVDQGMRLYVGQLHPNVTEADLRPVFEAFGPVDFVDLKLDPGTGESKGFAFVQYKHSAEAKTALQALDGLELAGRRIKVGAVDASTEGIQSLNELDAGENDDGDGGGIGLTAQGRAALMQRLSRGMVQTPGVGGGPPRAAPAPMHRSAPTPTLIQPTTCLVVKNMFSPATESEPEWWLDIRDDVMEECEKYGPAPIHCEVDRENQQGVVYLQLRDVPSSTRVQQAFHGRFFASRQIVAEFVSETTYFMKFPKQRR
eukprot:CAMPEP_0205819980 /NCGR_PEP_ID=MMETSP0206-20130828/2530_1 /ASSEMBLY_ACC=CAM_ASM_000279 /TAXON_ID=36767 /ORGANISM="Euplotes focardii, Strain TN1" /LENGTH=352 /DNA_ID=CAMNT_0053114213 /DNA_START=130 /DNA_END=1188 /DNA_ORIENTATION=-